MLDEADAYEPAFALFARTLESSPRDQAALDGLVRTAIPLGRSAAARLTLERLAADPANDEALDKALGADVVLAGDQTLVERPQADQFVRTEPLARFNARGAWTGIASVSLSGD